jgi:hypothetical protein
MTSRVVTQSDNTTAGGPADFQPVLFYAGFQSRTSYRTNSYRTAGDARRLMIQPIRNDLPMAMRTEKTRLP